MLTDGRKSGRLYRTLLQAGATKMKKRKVEKINLGQSKKEEKDGFHGGTQNYYKNIYGTGNIAVGDRHIRSRWLRWLNAMENFPRSCGSEVVDGKQSNKSDRGSRYMVLWILSALWWIEWKKGERYSMTESFKSRYIHRGMCRCNRVFF